MNDDSIELEELQAEYQSGNPAVLERLFAQFRPRLRQMICLRIGAQLQSRIDPSDVLQEAYLDAENKIGRYFQHPSVSPFVWLRGVTFDRLAKLQRHHLGTRARTATKTCSLPENSSVQLAQGLVAQAATASAMVSQRELYQQLQHAIDLLSDEDREIILMRHFEGLTNSDVAETLQIKPTTATMRHGRALARLRTQLAKISHSAG